MLPPTSFSRNHNLLLNNLLTRFHSFFREISINKSKYTLDNFKLNHLILCSIAIERSTSRSFCFLSRKYFLAISNIVSEIFDRFKIRTRKIRGGRWRLATRRGNFLTGIGLSVEFWMLITRKKGDEIASGKLIGPEESEAAF